MADIIIVGIVVFLMVLIIFKRVKAHKSGKGGCGCGCSNCSRAGYCDHEQKH
ncbi:MAG: FeoB-associated Cys-rich membrane protein [Clostridium sp.]|nr:FeoB-associated Cys-rich membrane protein [Clostridium sp.]